MSASECVVFSKGDNRMFTNRLARLFASATSALLLIALLGVNTQYVRFFTLLEKRF
jgi:hypothetical protein